MEAVSPTAIAEEEAKRRNELISQLAGAVPVVLETGERIGVPLTPADVLVQFAPQRAGHGDKAVQALECAMPESIRRGRLLPRNERVARVARALRDDQSKRCYLAERFDDERPFWDRMGVEDPLTAYGFETGYYTRTALELGCAQPVEMEWLRVADPVTFEGLQSMQQRHGLRLREPAGAPKVVLDSVGNIADDTHKSYVYPWLSRYLRDGKLPAITGDERKRHDYDTDLAVISAFKERALGIEADAKLSDEENSLLGAANKLLVDGLAGEYALGYILHDYAKRESESLRKLLPALVALSTAAWGIQNYAPNEALKACAKIAGSGDDVAAEGMSLSQLRLSSREMLRRMSWFIPLAVGMIVADYCVDSVDRLVNPNIGGMMYGATTVGLSAASTISSFAKHRTRYGELVDEGRIRPEDRVGKSRAAFDHYIAKDPLRRGIVAGIVAGPAISGALWPLIADKPYIYVPLGAIEPIVAFLSTQYEEWRMPRLLKKYARARARDIKAGQLSAAPWPARSSC